MQNIDNRTQQFSTKCFGIIWRQKHTYFVCLKIIIWLLFRVKMLVYTMKYTQVWTCKLVCVLMNDTLCDKVWQWLAAGLWFSPGIPVSSSNKTDRHDITDILLKVALNTNTLTMGLIIISAKNVSSNNRVGPYHMCNLECNYLIGRYANFTTSIHKHAEKYSKCSDGSMS